MHCIRDVIPAQWKVIFNLAKMSFFELEVLRPKSVNQFNIKSKIKQTCC